jgi:hypothetical protein
VKYDNREANVRSRKVSEAKTIAIRDKISKLDINWCAAYAYQPDTGIDIAMRCVNSYSKTEAHVKGVTHVSF